MSEHIENSIWISGDWSLVLQYEQALKKEFPDSSISLSEAGNDYATLDFTFDYNARFLKELKSYAKNLLEQLNKARASQRIFGRNDPAKLEYYWYYILGSEINEQLNGTSGYYDIDGKFFDSSEWWVNT